MTGNTPSDETESTARPHSAFKRTLFVVLVCMVALAFAFGGTVNSLALSSDEYRIFDGGSEPDDPYWPDATVQQGSFSDGILTDSGSGAKVTFNRIEPSRNITRVTTYVQYLAGDKEAKYFVDILDGSGTAIANIELDDEDNQVFIGGSQRSGGFDLGTLYKIVVTFDHSSDTFDGQIINTTSGQVLHSADNEGFNGNGIAGIQYEQDAFVTNDDLEIYNITVTNPGRVPVYELSGKVTSATNGTAIEGATVDITQADLTAETGVNGRYRQGGIENGTYDVTVSAPGYANQTETVVFDGENEVQDFQLEPESQSLSIETRRHLEHAETADYEVTFRNLSGGQADATDVTGQADVTSLNTTILTVNENRVLVVATNDTSINARTKIEANYTAPNGETFTATQNVTVANLTADNLKILPTSARLEAALEGGIDVNRDDRTVVVILIATMMGVAAALLATSFAGVALMCLTMIAGWLAGYVGDGMVMVAVLAGMFIGLNVAANIDYSTIRNRE